MQLNKLLDRDNSRNRIGFQVIKQQTMREFLAIPKIDIKIAFRDRNSTFRER
jgi:hypothetical protein